jgi:hypothetical protein
MTLTGSGTETERRKGSMIGLAATGTEREISGTAALAEATGHVKASGAGAMPAAAATSSVNVVLAANAVTVNGDSAATVASAENAAMAGNAVSAATVANGADGLTPARANGEIANPTGNARAARVTSGATPVSAIGIGKIGARREATPATIGVVNRNVKLVLAAKEEAQGPVLSAARAGQVIAVFGLHAFFPVTGNPAQVDSVQIEMVNSAGSLQTGKVRFTTTP